MSRLLLWTEGRKLPKVFKDWYEVADWIKQENLAGRSVTIIKWEYT